jgi:hypothetical protein
MRDREEYSKESTRKNETAKMKITLLLLALGLTRKANGVKGRPLILKARVDSRAI